jgi:hypothetical protein
MLSQRNLKKLNGSHPLGLSGETLSFTDFCDFHFVQKIVVSQGFA